MRQNPGWLLLALDHGLKRHVSLYFTSQDTPMLMTKHYPQNGINCQHPWEWTQHYRVTSNKAIRELFDLKSFEWTKISRDFYQKKRHKTVHERPSAEEALQLVARLPSPFSNDQYKGIFQKLIDHVAKQVDTTDKDVCAQTRN